MLRCFNKMQINHFKYVPLILEIYLMTLCKKFGQTVEKLLGGGEEGGGSSPHPVSDRVKESDRQVTEAYANQTSKMENLEKVLNG